MRILIGKLFVICALVLLLGPGAGIGRVITNIMSDDTKYLLSRPGVSIGFSADHIQYIVLVSYSLNIDFPLLEM